jgi:hypothetical protein
MRLKQILLAIVTGVSVSASACEINTKGMKNPGIYECSNAIRTHVIDTEADDTRLVIRNNYFGVKFRDLNTKKETQIELINYNCELKVPYRNN